MARGVNTLLVLETPETRRLYWIRASVGQGGGLVMDIEERIGRGLLRRRAARLSARLRTSREGAEAPLLRAVAGIRDRDLLNLLAQQAFPLLAERQFGRPNSVYLADSLLSSLQAAGPPAVAALVHMLKWYAERESILSTSLVATASRDPAGRAPSRADRSGPPGRSKRAAVILSGLGPKALDPLLEAVNDPLPRARAAVAFALASFREPRAEAALRFLLRDLESGVRIEAVLGISANLGVAAEPLLIEKIFNDSNEDVREHAARALAGSPSDQACDALSIVLERDPSLNVRLASGLALATARDTRAFRPLVNLLESLDESCFVAAAAEALGVLGDKRAADPLLSKLARAIGASHLGAYTEDVPALIAALGEIGDGSAVPTLCRIVADTAGDRRGKAASRRAAAKALGKLRDKSSLAPLMSLLLDREGDFLRDSGPGVSRLHLRDAAAEALGRLGDVSCTPALVPTVVGCDDWLAGSEYDLVSAAGVALSHLGEMATSTLANELSTDRWRTRSRVSQALKSAGWKPTSCTQSASFFLGLEDWSSLETLGPECVRDHILRLIESFAADAGRRSMLSMDAADELKHLGWAHALSDKVVDLFASAATYRTVTRYLRGEGNRMTDWFDQEVSLIEGNKALRALCRCREKPVSSLLRLLSQKRDDEAVLDWARGDYPLDTRRAAVSYADRRAAALKELHRRKLPPYDVGTFFDLGSRSSARS